MSTMQRVAVYCGAQPGHDPMFMSAARELGAALAREGLGLVYGGSSVGMMGAVADAALAAGSEAIGVIPRLLTAREPAHAGLTKLHVVDTMHQRKALMAEYASAFIALPGGFGTFEEIFEVVTWAQIHVHDKPCVLLNIGGYYDQLLGFLDSAVGSGLLRSEYRSLMQSASTVDEALRLVTMRLLQQRGG